ncbi:MAG: hypothetical protein H0V97_09230 [Actinobacteria bacterium]|nr:hypothetical protein [Actinomycetota bacterium]
MAIDSRVRVAMLVGALVIGVAIGILFGFILDDGGNDTSPQAVARPDGGVGPTDETNGVPVGYARTEEGAIAAATNFSLLSGRNGLLDLEALTTAMRTLAAPSWEEEAANQARDGYEYIVDAYGEDADISASALRYNLMDFDPDSAVVRLWTVSVASGSQRPSVEEVWAIVTVDLVWVDGDWRVQGTESAVGPAPVDLPSRPPQETASTLMEEFDEFDGAPVP